MSIAIRAAVADDVPAIASLIEVAYGAAMAHHHTAKGREIFLKFVTPGAIAARPELGLVGPEVFVLVGQQGAFCAVSFD